MSREASDLIVGRSWQPLHRVSRGKGRTRRGGVDDEMIGFSWPEETAGCKNHTGSPVLKSSRVQTVSLGFEFFFVL